MWIRPAEHRTPSPQLPPEAAETSIAMDRILAINGRGPTPGPDMVFTRTVCGRAWPLRKPWARSRDEPVDRSTGYRAAAGAGKAVLRLALHRDGDALSFPHLATARAGQTAHSRDRPPEGPLLAATFIGTRRDLTDAALLRAFVALPLVTVKIVAAIHWEALRLWLKGARLVSRADATAANTILAAGKRNDYIGAALPAAARSKPDQRSSALVH
jgi:hypothetical protein